MVVYLKADFDGLANAFCPPGRDHAAVLGVPASYFWHAQQVHGVRVAQVSGRPEPGKHIVGGVDGLFSMTPGTAMQIRTADCGPLLLWHPAGAAAVVHAGRAGLFGGIIEEAVGIFTGCGLSADDIAAWFGPSLGPCCHETGADSHVDMWEEAKRRLCAMKLRSGNICIESLCTACNHYVFASFRVRGDLSGSNILAAVVPCT